MEEGGSWIFLRSLREGHTQPHPPLINKEQCCGSLFHFSLALEFRQWDDCNWELGDVHSDSSAGCLTEHIHLKPSDLSQFTHHTKTETGRWTRVESFQAVRFDDEIWEQRFQFIFAERPKRADESSSTLLHTELESLINDFRLELTTWLGH